MKFYWARSAHRPSIIAAAQSGFTLFELAIALLITGLIAAAAASIALPALKETHIITTETKMDRIAKAIDFYATQNYRVPCPAMPSIHTASPPFGYDRQSGPNGDQIPTDCGGNNFGIVPYKTLGIPADWARDAWGNYFTYAVSPAFAQNTAIAGLPNTFPVHPRCRTADWYNAPMVYEAGNTTTPQYVHKNPQKAMFCCPYPQGNLVTSDLVINDVNGISQLTTSRATGQTAPLPLPQCAGQSLANMHPEAVSAPGKITMFPDPTISGYSTCYIADNNRPTTPVYVIVSHGPNGIGAWNVNAPPPGARNPLTNATPDEAINASDGRIFYEIPPLDRTGAEATFDDFVLWRTQDMIFANQGKSCATP